MTIERYHTSEKLSKVVIHNDTIYLCGQVADNFDLDIGEQTAQTLSKVDRLLEEFGSDKTKILSTMIFVKNTSLISEMNSEWFKWMPKGFAPARACVQAEMGLPEILVEVTVVAAK